MGKKVLAAKSGRAACSCAAAGGGIGAKNAKGAKTKPSGIPWIGDIPERWEIGRLKSVLIANDGGVWGDDPLDDDSDIIVLRSTEQSIDGRLIIEAPAKRQLLEGDKEKSLLKEGDLIITKSSGSQEHIGKTSIIDKTTASMRCCYSNFLQRLRVEGSSLFFWYVMNSYMVKMQFDYLATTTTGLKNLNAQIIGNLQISLPPLSEQRAIAAYLDEKCGAIDAAIAEAKKGIEEYKAWKKSLIFEVVTGKRRVGFFNAETRCARDEVVGLPERSEPEGPQGAARRRVAEKMKSSGIPWIGDVPVGWEVKRLKYIASCNDDSLTEDTPLDFSFDYVDVGSVKYGLGIVQREPMLFAHAPSRARRVVRKDDVIVSTVRTYLKSVAQIPQFNKPLIVSTGFAVLRAKNVDTIFLSYALQSQSFVDEVEARSTGISYPAINASDLVGIKLPLPLLSEQKAIAAYLDEKCSAIDAMIAEKEALIADLEAYKKSLIYETVTGKREVASNSMVK